MITTYGNLSYFECHTDAPFNLWLRKILNSIFFQAENTLSVLLQYSLCCGFANAFILFQQHLYLMVILNLIPA